MTRPASPSLVRLVILDLDGVVYRGDRPIAGATELVAHLVRAGAVVRYATNNSMFTRQDFARHLTAMGIPARPDEVVTSTWATIQHLHRNEPGFRRVLALGAAGMVTELMDAGFEVMNRATDVTIPDAVVVGLDPAFSPERRDRAAAAIRGGARFIATNADTRYPLPDGFRPGAGAVVEAIREASGVEPMVIGKPQPAMFEAILAESAVAPAEAVVIGDNPDSDIVAARRAGMRSILVLTGVTAAADVAGLDGERAPDFVVAGPDEAWDLLAPMVSR